jgi:hypothetical protein
MTIHARDRPRERVSAIDFACRDLEAEIAARLAMRGYDWGAPRTGRGEIEGIPRAARARPGDAPGGREAAGVRSKSDRSPRRPAGEAIGGERPDPGPPDPRHRALGARRVLARGRR